MAIIDSTAGDNVLTGGEGNDTPTRDGGGAGGGTPQAAPAEDPGKPQAAIGDIVRASTDASGTQTDNGSIVPVFSPDGTKIAFGSAASNLVAGDTNASFDVFVKDLITGAVTRVSTDSLGGESNSYSSDPVFSPDGTKVAFVSLASNLAAGDTNATFDVFVKDLVTGAITWVSTDALGGQGNDLSLSPVFSPDGTKVAFTSYATNLVAGDTNGAPDIFIKDLITGAITRVSTDASGVEGNNSSDWVVFSPDGTRVAFYSFATNLVAGDTNSAPDIFVKDLTTGAITRVSTGPGGEESDGASYFPVFSPDGTKVAFTSYAANLVAGDTNNAPDIFLKDLVTGATTLISTDASGVQGDSSSDGAVFSPDGTKVAFLSYASNLVAGDTNGVSDLFIKDLRTGAIERVSTDASGAEANGPSRTIRFSPDGALVAFQSDASNLVAGDTNVTTDIFIKTIGVSAPAPIVGTAGNDRMGGTAGADHMLGGLGDDFYVVNDAGDEPDETGGDGIDTVQSRISWTLGADIENLILGSAGGSTNGTGNELDNVLTGNSFANTLSGLAGNDTLIGGGGADVLYGGDDDDSLDGGNQDDQLYGGAGTDVLVGGAGNDLLDGGTGDDTMTGGAGNDTYYVDSAADVVNEGAGGGTDTVYVQGLLNYTLAANVENLVLDDLCLNGTGNALNNIITGSGAFNTLRGLGGNDIIYGGDKSDTLDGGDGNDVLYGDNGDDFLYGAAGQDKLTGGVGSDGFIFTDLDIRISAGVAKSDKDQILDLNFAQGDFIDLSGIDANINLDGDQAFVFVSKFTKIAGQAVLTYSAATGLSTLALDVDGDGIADLRIEINGDVTGTKGNGYTSGGGDFDGGWIL